MFVILGVDPDVLDVCVEEGTVCLGVDFFAFGKSYTRRSSSQIKPPTITVPVTDTRPAPRAYKTRWNKEKRYFWDRFNDAKNDLSTVYDVAKGVVNTAYDATEAGFKWIKDAAGAARNGRKLIEDTGRIAAVALAASGHPEAAIVANGVADLASSRRNSVA